MKEKVIRDALRANYAYYIDMHTDLPQQLDTLKNIYFSLCSQ